MVIPSRLDRPARGEPPPVATFERLTDDPAWVVRLAGFNPAGERAVETLLSVANGLVGTRGTLEETASASLPGVFVAGLFDPVHEALDPPADLTEAPALVNEPNWAALTLDVDGERITIETGDTLRHQRALDLRQALLLRDWRPRHPSGRITWVVTLRCAVGAERRALLQRAWIVPENYDAALTLLVTLDGRHAERVRTAAERWRTGAGEVALVSGRTPRSGLAVALAQSARLRHHGGEVAAKVDVTEAAARHRFDWRGEAGTTYRLDRIVAIATSRDGGDTAERAVRMAPAFARRGVDALLAAHRGAWAERWADADVRIQGDTAAQRAVRLAGYHLMAAANPEDERVSIGARGLSGPIYRGHVFWDTEIYMLPFFVFTWPAAARTLLMYRYHGLEAARAKARSLGYRGALYPWEAALSGHEATPRTLRDPEVARFYGVLGAAFYEETARTGERPGGSVPIRNGLLAPHTSADIAYAVRQYWQATGDDVFLARAGAEILLETARFWASRAVLEADGHYHIRGGIGPDEYHEEIDDSAYTNAMARLNLEFADGAAGERTRSPRGSDRAVRRIPRPGRPRPASLGAANRGHAGGPRPRADPADAGDQAGGRRAARPSPLGSARPDPRGAVLRVLRAAVRPRQQSVTVYPRARRRPAGTTRRGATLFRPGGHDRSRGKPEQRGARHPYRGGGRPLAGRRLRSRRPRAHRGRSRLRPAPAPRLGGLGVPAALARPPPAGGDPGLARRHRGRGGRGTAGTLEPGER